MRRRWWDARAKRSRSRNSDSEFQPSPEQPVVTFVEDPTLPPGVVVFRCPESGEDVRIESGTVIDEGSLFGNLGEEALAEFNAWWEEWVLRRSLHGRRVEIIARRDVKDHAIDPGPKPEPLPE